MTDQFDGPGSVSGIKWENLLGRLVLIKPMSVEKILTAFGEAEPIRAEVTVIDAPGGVEEYPDTLIFPRVLAGQVRNNIGTGRMNLGRVGRGTQKPGQSAPWILQDPNDADRAIARDYLNKSKLPF